MGGGGVDTEGIRQIGYSLGILLAAGRADARGVSADSEAAAAAGAAAAGAAAPCIVLRPACTAGVQDPQNHIQKCAGLCGKVKQGNFIQNPVGLSVTIPGRYKY